MIVLVHSYLFAGVTELSRLLAARFDDGAALELEQAELPGVAALERVGIAVKDARAGSASTLVWAFDFGCGAMLREARQYLDRFDDVIYAYRLLPDPDVLCAFAALAQQPEVELLHAYHAWRQAQEADADHYDTGYPIPVRSTDWAQAANAIWDDVHQPISLSPYQDSWPGLFDAEKQRILEVLAGTCVDVQHIGSTAVTGLCAKPIIDILISVQSFGLARTTIGPLRELGYAFIDFPVNRDRLFFCKGQPRSDHAHVVEHGGHKHLAHVRFRDVLRQDAELRARYQALKQAAMASFATQRAAYGEQKSPFIREVLESFPS